MGSIDPAQAAWESQSGNLIGVGSVATLLVFLVTVNL